MTINRLPVASEVRQPRGIIKISSTDSKGVETNAEVMIGWTSFEVENNNFYQADTFRVTFALSLLPAKRDLSWWSTQTQVFCEIFAGFPADVENYSISDLQSLIYGRVDSIDFDFVGRTLEICGRDFTAVLIDTKTTQKWPNKKASDIATDIAKSHGLTPVVTKTQTKAGTYYRQDFVTMTEQRSEWDLLCLLAANEDFVVYIKGKELHFEDQPEESDNPYVLQWEDETDQQGFGFNGKTINFYRNLSLAKGITVTVRSHNQRGQGFSKSYPTPSRGTQAGKAKPLGAQQSYTYIFANKTPEWCLKKAQALHKEITEHEVRLSAQLPADNLLSASDVIKVIGTGTSFDQIYYPESVTRSMSVQGGYEMKISAKNHSTENAVIS